ncbi:MAG: hypothetical protein A2006_01855 [Ignavibacteria bacterium GWC2_35_8]|nr:MAG: hypothetical protein A2006_01855 [Ignavibacteria bacterium GWC2_35_8]
MKTWLSIITLIVISSCLDNSMLAQNENGFDFIKANYDRTFPDDFTVELINPNSLFMDSYEKSESILEELRLTTKDIIGKEMIFDYDLFTVEMVVSSDSILSWKSIENEKVENETTRTIHIDEHTTLKSWLEADNTFITVYADYRKGETHAVLYRTSGKVESISGTINQKK